MTVLRRFLPPGAAPPRLVRRALRSGLVVPLLLLVALAVWIQVGSTQDPPPLRVEIVDADSGEPAPARFSLFIEGKPFHPLHVGANALRFVSVHQSKQQILAVTYARGTGPVEIELPAGARQVAVHAARGFEFLPVAVTQAVSRPHTPARLALRRWTNLTAQGWSAADAHVHYDRLDRNANRDWFAMMEGDGLAQLHFMTAKGGQAPGVWAEQYAYGRAGEATDGTRLVTAGEEYRDTAQGHINLLGLGELIQPIMAGTGGQPNHPPLHDVLVRARELGGLPGVAHGGSLNREPTAALDAVLGAMDHFEIANSHIYSLDLWYRLLNAGFHLPPTAGTDLPNYPDRDPWQPFLGSVRTYVKAGAVNDFEAWKTAVKRGATFITSGPLLAFTVNGRDAGAIIQLPAAGGEVLVESELASPIGLRQFELIRNGRAVTTEVERTDADGIHRWRIRQRLPVTESCWLAVRGEGVPIEALKRARLAPVPWHKSDAVAHSAAVRVIVGGRPIRGSEDLTALRDELRRKREFYQTQARYETAEQREQMTRLFDRGIRVLEQRLRQAANPR